MASEAGSIVGSGTQAVGALIAGQQQSNALDTSAEIQRRNASEAKAAGEFNAHRQELIAGQKIGTTEAAFGASGISTDSGSALDVLMMAHTNAELDRLNILHGADIKAINYQNQASMDELGAKQTLQGSYFNAFSSVVMGGGKAYGAGAGTASQYGGSTAEEGAATDVGGGEAASSSASMDALAL